MAKKSNLYFVNNSLALRYIGRDTKEILLFIAERITDYCAEVTPEVLESVCKPNNVIPKQIRIIDDYLKMSSRGDVPLSNEERLVLVNCIETVNNIKEIKGLKYGGTTFVFNCNLLEAFAKKMENKIKDAGLVCTRKDSFSTCSSYIFPDNKVLRGIRVSDHETDECLKFKHNVIIGAKITHYSVKSNKDAYGRDYYIHYTPHEDFKEVSKIILQSVLKEREEKLATMGEEQYMAQRLGNESVL